jgi:hypothetical protein
MISLGSPRGLTERAVDIHMLGVMKIFAVELRRYIGLRRARAVFRGSRI